MRVQVPLTSGIESLFGTRDENIRLIESGLNVRTRVTPESIEIEGDQDNVLRAERIIDDFATLQREGTPLPNGDLNNYLRVVVEDPEVTLLRDWCRADVSVHSERKHSLRRPSTSGDTSDSIERNDLVFGVGPAGTGKTYLAVAMAVSALLNKKIARIILTRPAVEAGERLGFLPGTLQEKVDPYLRPLYDALYDMVDAERVEKMLERGVIEVAPIAFMRGRTLNDAFIIVDEAQNTTPEQMKMVLTRLGFNSKMVVTGDVTQIDLPGRTTSGLVQVIDILRGTEGIGFVFFEEVDVVRHTLVQRIVRAYERYNQQIGAGRQFSLKLASNEPEPAPEPAIEG